MCPQVSHSELTAELSAVELKRLHNILSHCTILGMYLVQSQKSKYSRDECVIKFGFVTLYMIEDIKGEH